VGCFSVTAAGGGSPDIIIEIEPVFDSGASGFDGSIAAGMRGGSETHDSNQPIAAAVPSLRKRSGRVSTPIVTVPTLGIARLARIERSRDRSKETFRFHRFDQIHFYAAYDRLDRFRMPVGATTRGVASLGA
jgi:hypothetical protein